MTEFKDRRPQLHKFSMFVGTALAVSLLLSALAMSLGLLITVLQWVSRLLG